MALVGYGLLTGCVAAVLYALQTANVAEFASLLAATLMIAGASLLAGALLGFLFGIPRTLQQGELKENPPDGKAVNAPGGSGAGESQPNSYQQNTNLEQISDWLTKILVGVGLTQISKLPDAVHRFASYAAPGLGAFPSSGVFGSALLIYFLICGFLTSYLWTRLSLLGLFREADVTALGGKLARVETKVSELEKQREVDTGALSVVLRQLNPGAGDAPLTQEAVDAALKQASPNVKAQVFYLAQNARRDNWSEHKNKPKMERTIPIFRALIGASEDVYHRNHAQLGFALKDQREPNWREAETELSKAIKLRGPWKDHGWLLYEFNRGLCRIHLDEGFDKAERSREEVKRPILEDLAASNYAGGLRELLDDDPDISRWMKLNGVTRATLARVDT